MFHGGYYTDGVMVQMPYFVTDITELVAEMFWVCLLLEHYGSVLVYCMTYVALAGRNKRSTMDFRIGTGSTST